MSSERPYTPERLAERWDCSARHVRSLIAKGLLPAFHVGTLTRIRREDVEAFECGSSSTEERGAPHGRGETAPNESLSASQPLRVVWMPSAP